MSAGDRNAIEAEIIRHLESGDLSRAAEVILRDYGGEVLGYLGAVTRDPVVADEVFSMVAEDVWRGLAGFRRESTARTWLYRLAWHAVQRRRDDAFERRRAPLPPALDAVAHDVRSRTAPFLRTEVKDAVARLRQQLEPREQSLLILRVDRGLSWREVASVMSGPDLTLDETTLAKRFERVKRKLRRLATESGLLADD